MILKTINFEILKETFWEEKKNTILLLTSKYCLNYVFISVDKCKHIFMTAT